MIFRTKKFIFVILIYGYAGHGLAFEERSIDGTNNNLTNPSMGAVNTQLLRQGNAHYCDAISSLCEAVLPSERLISNSIASQTSSMLNTRNLSSLTWQWGQFIDHDISLTESAYPSQPMQISVPTGDAYFDPFSTGLETIDLTRSIYDKTTGTSISNPRQQINEITSWIDASQVYGSDETRQAELRSFSGGRLLTSAGNLLRFNDNGLQNGGGDSASLFLAGDVRANEQLGLIAMHTLFMREHNRRADQIATDNPLLSDEEIFQQARKVVGATIQNITYTGFLPALLGDNALSNYSAYDATVDASIKNEFSTAGFRFGHTMLPNELLRLDNSGETIAEGNIDLQSSFFNPSGIISIGIDPYLKGLSMQHAQELDNKVVDGVRNFLFGLPGSGGFDLASLNIARGRDHGLADYNQMRIDYGLMAATSFSDISSDPQLQALLFDLYGDIDNIDAWVGGLAEDSFSGGNLGELFSTIVIDQFEALRDGDRFWYQNDDFFLSNASLLAEINQISLKDIIELNTDLTGLQTNVFFVQVSHPPILYLFFSGLFLLVSLRSSPKAKFLAYKPR
jgi:hypothetical protein